MATIHVGNPMPDAKLLIELLRAISYSGITSQGLADLEELLGKISQTKDHVHIEANYDGREWHWKVEQANVQAGQWTPSTLENTTSHKP